MAIADITKPMALDETLQDTNTALGLLGKDTTLQAIVTALGNIGINTVGNLASLVTTDKSSLVGAVNELAGDIDDLDTDKANKVSSATAGNLAGLDSNGDLTDANWSADKTTTNATGNPISISGLKSNQLAVNPIITFEPIQAGSGTPSPSNVRAISGYDKVEVESCGKNLVRGFIPQPNYAPTIVKNGNSYTISGYGGAFINVLLKSGKTYVLSFTLTSGTINNIRLYADLNATTLLFAITQGVAFTPTQDGYIRFWIDGTVVLTNLQLEEGTSATTYVPYVKATSISESLGQTVYGGSLDLRSGKLMVTKMLVDLGSLTWYRYNTTSIFHANPTGQKIISSVVCDSYNGVNSRIINLQDKEISANAETFSTGCKIGIRDDSYTDATAFGNSLTGKYAVTELATPITIQLTPHEISLLKDYAYVSTNGTNIALDYHNGELASLSDVSQLGETVNEGFEVAKGNIIVIKKLWSGLTFTNNSTLELDASETGYEVIGVVGSQFPSMDRTKMLGFHELYIDDTTKKVCLNPYTTQTLSNGYVRLDVLYKKL